jgi:predicted transcriptional regulator
MSQPNTTKSVSVKLDSDTRSRIDNLAIARERSSHWVMREAILQYVNREERREAFRRDTLKAWDEYQASGAHATADEVETWLRSWGTETETPTPPCRA